MTKRDEILITAIKLAQQSHYTKITREAIAKKLNISDTLISYYFKTMRDLKHAVVQRAIEEEILDIICQALCVKDLLVRDCTLELKMKAAKNLLN